MTESSAAVRAGEHLGPGRVHAGVVRRGQRGELGEVAGEPEVAVAAERPAPGPGRRAGRRRRPASAISRASAASGAGLRWAGLPSYQPP